MGILHLRRKSKSLSVLGIISAALVFCLHTFGCPVINRTWLDSIANLLPSDNASSQKSPKCERACCHNRPSGKPVPSDSQDCAGSHQCCWQNASTANLGVPSHAQSYSIGNFSRIGNFPEPFHSLASDIKPAALIAPPVPDTPLYLLRLRLLI